jgi:peptidyl-tRNA hydrolase
LVECLGEDFARVRIGIGTPTDGTDLAAWVLSVPPVAEEAVLKQAYEKNSRTGAGVHSEDDVSQVAR